MRTIYDAYRYWRGRGKAAREARHLAKIDAFCRVDRYASSKVGYGSGQPFAAFGEKHMRWIESPRAAGLRFVGYADKLAKLDGTGWYLDDYQDETARGVVYQMAARNGRAQFVAGYEDSCNGKADRDGPACISFDDIHDGDMRDSSWDDDSGAKEAAYSADHIASRMAEEERDYRRASAAGLRYRDLGEEVARIRSRALALIGEIKSHKGAVCDAPAIVAALRDKLERMLDDIREAREERNRLLDDYGREAAFRDA